MVSSVDGFTAETSQLKGAKLEVAVAGDFGREGGRKFVKCSSRRRNSTGSDRVELHVRLRSSSMKKLSSVK